VPYPSFWIIAAGLLLAVAFWFRFYRANRLLARQIEAERQRTKQMRELHLATIEALALAIDAKDHTTSNHISRVDTYATAVAREMGISGPLPCCTTSGSSACPSTSWPSPGR